MQNDGFENLKRAWLYVRQNKYLWLIAFVIAFAGGGSQGFSLWVQSPIPRGLTGLSPVHRIGTRITDFAHGNAAFWALFLIIGFFVGVVVVAAGAFAQASAIGAVSDIEYGHPSGLGGAWEWGKSHFPRFFVLVLGYLLVIAVIAAPSYLFWWTIGKKGTILPCLGALIFGVGLVVAMLFLSILFELAARYLVIEDRGIFESVHMAYLCFKDFWREVVLTWLYVLAVSILGAIVMVAVIAVLSIPLSSIFTMADRHHNAFTIALAMLSFIVVWGVAAAASGIFIMTGSTLWTLTFIEIK